MFYKLDIIVDEKAGVTPVIEFNFNRLGNAPVDEPSLFPNKKPLTQVFLPPYKLVANTELRDVLSGFSVSKSKGLFISERFKFCLLKLKTPTLLFYPLDLEDDMGKAVQGYYYAQTIIEETIIDYQKSSFYVMKLLDIVGDIDVVSEEDFILQSRILIKERRRIKHKKIVLNEYYANYDLFFLNNCGLVDFIVSEKGKAIIEREEISGIQFKLMPEIEAKETNL